MKRLFFWDGHDTADLYAISLFKIFGIMILAFISGYILAQQKFDDIFLNLWDWISSLVIGAAFLISSARRLRDVGRSIALLAIFPVPVLGPCLFVYLLVAKSRPASGKGQPGA